MNEFDQVSDAVAAARRLDEALNRHARSMADLLVGRLRSVEDSATLSKLKRELRAYNIHTGQWSPR